jgi:hypothetical protein
MNKNEINWTCNLNNITIYSSTNAHVFDIDEYSLIEHPCLFYTLTIRNTENFDFNLICTSVSTDNDNDLQVFYQQIDGEFTIPANFGFFVLYGSVSVNNSNEVLGELSYKPFTDQDTTITGYNSAICSIKFLNKSRDVTRFIVSDVSLDIRKEMIKNIDK